MKAPLATHLRKIPLFSLAPSPFNARCIRTEARVAGIARSLADDGQREPITVYPGTGENAGKYLIVSGVTRYLAALSLGWETLEAREDTTLDPANALLLVRASHLHNDTCRETELDHALLAKKLREARHPVEAIAQALGYGSKRSVSRLKAFFDLPAQLLELGKTKPEKFSATFAELFRGFVAEQGEAKALALLASVFEQDLSLNETERLMEREAKRGVRMRARRSGSWAIRLEGEEIGKRVIQKLPDGRLKVQMAVVLEPGLGAALNERLEAVLEDFVKKAETEDA
jgi:ParB/RepB/Spo0J family partition protein